MPRYLHTCTPNGAPVPYTILIRFNADGGRDGLFECSGCGVPCHDSLNGRLPAYTFAFYEPKDTPVAEPAVLTPGEPMDEAYCSLACVERAVKRAWAAEQEARRLTPRPDNAMIVEP